MKKQSLLLIGGAMLAFASCQPENTGGGFTQEQVDSIVNVRVAEQMVALQASNDSTINALAQIKADSIIAAMKSGTSRPSSSSSTKNNTVNNGGGNKTTPTNPRGGIQSQSDQSKSETRGGIQSQSDQSKSEQKSSGRRGGIQSSSDQSQQR